MFYDSLTHFLRLLSLSILAFIANWLDFLSHQLFFSSFFIAFTHVECNLQSVCFEILSILPTCTKNHSMECIPEILKIGFNCINYFNEYGSAIELKISRESIYYLLHDNDNCHVDWGERQRINSFTYRYCVSHTLFSERV